MAHRVGQPRRLGAVYGDPLSLAGRLVRRGDLEPRAGGGHRCADMEATPAERRDLGVGTAAERSKEDGVVDGFQQIRLALPIPPEEGRALRGHGAVHLLQIPEPAHHQPLEPH